MRSLTALTALTALLAAGAVAGSGQAAPLSVPARVTPPSAGKYKGRTSQGLAMSFTVSRRHYVKPARFPARMKCPDGSRYTFTITSHFNTPRKILPNGYFGKEWIATSRLNHRYAAAVAGMRYGAATRAKGVVRVTSDRPDKGGLCDSGVVRWSATRR